MDDKPQGERKHPAEYERDLNPDRLAGQNLGTESAAAEQSGHTAFHLKELHRQLRGLTDDQLKQIPVLPPGARLQQGATYVDLNDRQRNEFTATGKMEATTAHAYVPKDGTPYTVWNRLIGVENPERL